MERAQKEHKDIQPIRKQLLYIKVTFLGLLIAISFVCFGCKEDYGELDTVFELLEENTSDSLTKQFKASDLDSVVVYNEKFIIEIKNIISDSVVTSNIKSVFNAYEIDLIGKEAEWTFMSAFHKYLNRRKYDIPRLFNRIIDIQDSIYEIKHSHIYINKNLKETISE